jgi:hypothetical protein
MKSFSNLLPLTVVLLSGVASAQQLAPVPDMHIPDIPYEAGGYESSEVAMGQPFIVDSTTFIEPAAYSGPLFTRVKYVDLDEKAPGAVPKIITVKNPLRKRGCCEPETVCIEICVPPCSCEKVKGRLFGNRIRFDYGEYAVDVRIKRDHIQVDYQD